MPSTRRRRMLLPALAAVALLLALAPVVPARGATEITVAIALTGNGSGRVQSTDAAFVPDGIIDCPMTRGIVDTTLCSHMYPDSGSGVVVYIKATPADGSELCDANGCTTGVRERSRLFTTSGTFAETFNLRVFDINLATAGAGSGRITSDPPYLTCPTECETSLEAGEVLVFTADPDPGSKFSKWTGGCAGQNATCEITLMDNLTTTAVFTVVTVATAEPTPEPTEPPEASPTPAPETASPTAERTEAPSAAPPTPEPTPEAVPDSAPTGPGAIVIVLGVVLVGLLAAFAMVVARGRTKPAP